MATRSKTFSFPYLASFSADYRDSTFSATATKVSTPLSTEISVDVLISDGVISGLISEGTLSLVALVVSQNTAMRSTFRFPKGKTSYTIAIPSSLVDERVRITILLFANKNFQYSNSGLDESFSGDTFSIEKGNILGESNDIDLYFHHGSSADSHSILTRSFDAKMSEDSAPTIQYRADTIDIVMPKGMYDMLGHLGEKEGNLPFIYSSFAVPALAQTISLLKNSDPSDDSSFAASHDSDKWLGILLEKTGSLDELSFEECWQKAETLLGKPVNSAIDGLKKQRDLAIQKGGSGND